MLPEQLGSAPTEVLAQQVDPSQPMNENISLPASNLVFVSPKQLANLLHVTTDCIYRLVAKRSLPVYRVLRRVLFRRTEVEHWLKTHRTDSREPGIWE